MEVKKYLVNNMGEAMEAIRADLGDEALIINQQYVRASGMFGYFKPKKLEVIAGCETPQTRVKKNQNRGSKRSKLMIKKDDVLVDNQEPNRPSYSATKNTSSPQDPVFETYLQRQDQDYRLLMDELSQNVDKQADEKERLSQADRLRQEVALHQGKQQADQKESEMNEIKRMLQELKEEKQVATRPAEERWHRLFEEFDFSKAVQEEIKLTFAAQKFELGMERHALYQFVQQRCEAIIQRKPIKQAAVQVFVGPPGVGKTTTIAKIASNEILLNQRKVGLITVDTYRIGAVEQLRDYAKILEAPIQVVFKPSEMRVAVERLKQMNCDLIIVDSIGRSHRDQDNLEDLTRFVTALEDASVYLVLNMAIKYRELEAIMTRFKPMNYEGFILTKLDESERNENILNVCETHQEPVIHLCTGQTVPTDIETPECARLTQFVWGGEHE